MIRRTGEHSGAAEATRAGPPVAAGIWGIRRPAMATPAPGAPRRRVVARTAGEFDAPCAVCGARPTSLLLEWQTDAYLAGPALPEREVELHACFEWRYYCPLHSTARAP